MAAGTHVDPQGRVVAKLLRPLSVSMGDAPFFVYTSDVRAEDIEALDSLRHCPVVFQRKVEKRREELRKECLELDRKRSDTIAQKQKELAAKGQAGFDGQVLEILRRQAKKAGVDY